MPIPKKLFQTARSFEALPQELKDNVEKLKELNPDWTYQLYEDAEMRNYIQQNISSDDWSELERLNPKYSVVLADLFRYLLIYNEGGVYLDIKSTAKKPLSKMIPSNASYLLSQWRNRLGEPFVGSGFWAELERVPGGEFQQWHVIAEPKHPFLKAVIDRTLHNIRTYTTPEFGVSSVGVFRVSGPICYTQAIWPILGHHSNQVVDIEALSFQYSIYQDMGDTYKYAKLSSNHYSKTSEPIFLKPREFAPSRFSRISVSEALAQVLRDNTDIVLKLSIVTLVSTLVLVFVVPIIVWLVIR